jgi:hypothetical protein
MMDLCSRRNWTPVPRRELLRTHRAARTALVAALCVATWSCSSGGQQDRSGATTLRLPSGLQPAASGLPTPTENVPLSIGAGSVVCLSHPGAATVVDVRGREATSNFAVEAFAVRPNPSRQGADQLGEVRGTLSDAGFDPAAHEVDMACDDGDGAGFELGIQIARTAPGIATSQGFEVDWKSGEEAGTLFIPLAVLLCDSPTAFAKRCDANTLLP